MSTLKRGLQGGEAGGGEEENATTDPTLEGKWQDRILFLPIGKIGYFFDLAQICK